MSDVNVLVLTGYGLNCDQMLEIGLRNVSAKGIGHSVMREDPPPLRFIPPNRR